jgi:hypothetical protein
VRVRIAAILFMFLPTLGCSHPPQPVRFTCPAHAKRGVYNNNRLHVLKECEWYRGKVTQAESRDDGDLHFLMQPDAGFTRFLNTGNYNDEGGNLVIEIMPGQKLPAPVVGEHIAVFGTWVLDEHNSWNEIHPVWGIRYLDRKSAAFFLPPLEPLYKGSSKD